MEASDAAEPMVVDASSRDEDCVKLKCVVLCFDAVFELKAVEAVAAAAASGPPAEQVLSARADNQDCVKLMFVFCVCIFCLLRDFS